MTDKQTLAERLEAALALVGKATPGRWFSDQHSPCNEGMEDNPDVSLWGQDGDAESFVCNIAFDWSRASDAEAVAAAVNLLRQHGEALAAIVRAVEGDSWQPIETCPYYKPVRLWIPQGVFGVWRGSEWVGQRSGGDSRNLGYDESFSVVTPFSENNKQVFVGISWSKPQPTHWRPLPDAPLDAAGSAEGRG